ncbi:MAG: arsinothricin resistance N-acetyltransferase ArsN1 family B [Bacteroidota bacterium]
MLIRNARPEDAEAFCAIYAPYVINSAVSFETEAPDEEEMRRRMAKNMEKYPWLVADINGEVAGYAYASAHRDRAAYGWSVETSVYVSERFKRRGIGLTLYKELIARLRKIGVVNLYGIITLPNVASTSLHEAAGFRPLIIFPEIGYKLGKWHNVGWWEMRLNENADNPGALKKPE